ncbi:hypothetical protein [Arsukibacterium perlucidum]|uniref:hypothetical protein n=1 Tax=Arsukibacterium perlucidum TaxID=368811 RepID=UPI00036504D3|nr:hypothetical protein [Arsukibacterium perlucidum]
MTDKNKATQQGGQSINNTHNNCNQNNTKLTTVKPASQLERVLLGLLYSGSMTCQEAEKLPVKARHLNSVISDLAHSYNLEILREREKAPGYLGETCHLIRYSVHQHQQAKARQLIDRWRIKRHAVPVVWIALRSVSLEKLLKTA